MGQPWETRFCIDGRNSLLGSGGQLSEGQNHRAMASSALVLVGSPWLNAVGRTGPWECCSRDRLQHARGRVNQQNAWERASHGIICGNLGPWLTALVEVGTRGRDFRLLRDEQKNHVGMKKGADKPFFGR